MLAGAKRVESGKGLNLNYLGSDGLIRNIYRGNQNAATVKKAYNDLSEIAKKLRAKGKKVLILADTRNLGHVSFSARREGIEVMRKLDYDKAAIIGDVFLYNNLVKIMVMVSGMGYKIKFFSDENEAREWLLEG